MHTHTSLLLVDDDAEFTGLLASRLSAVLARYVPDSLFGRLALLLVAVALASHVLALSLLLEFWPLTSIPPDHTGLHGQPLAAMFMDIAMRLGALLLVAWLGARWLAAPMHRLAEAARDLAQNIHRPPLSEAGTRECREATHVINQLQQHICEQLAERDQFVAAVSHDLHTPLTRLQLRVQSLENASERQCFGKDIAEMDSMIRATLDYLRAGDYTEPWTELDLRALVQGLACDNQAGGFAVNLCEAGRTPPHPIHLRAQHSALRCCIGKLIENAVHYGGSAEITLRQRADALCILVTDNGPGIPEAELGQVLLPFYRVEASRKRHAGGLGLGLAIAHDIARRHGGTLALSNRAGCGLQAELRFALKA